MATRDPFDLTDSKRSSVITLTPQPHSVDATLFNGAHYQHPSPAVLTAAFFLFFSLSCSLYFPRSNKRQGRRHTSLANIALSSASPLIPPPSLKTRARLGLFVGLTLAESLSLHRGRHTESLNSSATQWPLLGGKHNINPRKGREGAAQGPWGERIISDVFLADRRCQPCYGFRFPLMGRFKVGVAALK